MEGRGVNPSVEDPIKTGEKPDKQGRVGAAKGGRPRGSGSRQSQTKEAKAEREAKAQAAQAAALHQRATDIAADLEGVFLMLFGEVAARAGEHWNLTKKEANRLAYRVARVDIKWGGLLDKYGEEIMLVGCLCALGYPRIAEDRRLAREGAVKDAKVESIETTGKTKGKKGSNTK
jgi:hypothetical protein